MKFESGIGWYTEAYAIVKVKFPEDNVCCGHCKYHDKYKNQCKLDEDVVIYKPDRFVGGGCPLMLVEDKEDASNEQTDV